MNKRVGGRGGRPISDSSSGDRLNSLILVILLMIFGQKVDDIDERSESKSLMEALIGALAVHAILHVLSLGILTIPNSKINLRNIQE